MSCEHFKTRLMDLALGAEDREFGAHLEACAFCRAALESQRTLLASIDRGLASMVAGDPAGDFAAHVRQRIAQAGVTTRPWFAGWLPVTAAALALIVLVTLLMLRREGAPPERAKETPPVQVAPSEKAGAVAPPEMTRTEPTRTVAIARASRRSQPGANREPEVLVPRGEMAAIVRLVNANWSGKADGASLTAQLAPMSDSLKPLSIEELKIPALNATPPESGLPPGGSREIR